MGGGSAPRKRIASKEDVDVFLSSETYGTLIGFVTRLNTAVIGRKTCDPLATSPTVQAIMALLKHLSALVAEHPPVTTPSRFGNPSFKGWHQAMEEVVRTETSFVPEVFGFGWFWFCGRGLSLFGLLLSTLLSTTDLSCSILCKE